MPQGRKIDAGLATIIAAVIGLIGIGLGNLIDTKNVEGGIAKGKQTAVSELQPTIDAQKDQIHLLQTQVLSATETCAAFIERDGQVIFAANAFNLAPLPGRNHATDPGNLARNAGSVHWEEYPKFPGAVQAVPDDQLVNTQNDTNGPALRYSIEFTDPGTYYVDVQGIGVNDNGDSIIVGMANALTSTMTFLSPPDWEQPAWQGRVNATSSEPIYFNVAAPGIYTFYIWMRENGVVVRKIWLHKGKDAVRQGDTSPDPASSTCRMVVNKN